MTTFYIKSRKTMPIVISTLDAATREEAIAATIATAGEGEAIEVMQVQEGPYSSGPTGVSGASGPALLSAGAAKPTRAQLNDMTKEELIDLAEKQGVEVSHSWNKADIVDAIAKHHP